MEEIKGLSRQIRWQNRIYRIVFLVVFLLGWLLLSESETLSFIIPGPWEVVKTAIEIVPFLQRDLIATFYEIIMGFLLALFMGVVSGSLLGMNRFWGDILEPFIYNFNAIPKIIFFPVYLILFGVGTESKIVIGFTFGIVPILINSMLGVRNVKPVFLELAKTMNANRLQVFSKIYLPSILPYVLAGIRMGMSLTIVGVVIGEIYASRVGIGYRVYRYYSLFELPHMYACIIMIGIFAFLIYGIFLLIENRVRY